MEQTGTSNLFQLQQRFKQALQEELPASQADAEWLRDVPPIDLRTRLRVYQYAYWARLLESLEEDFPRTLEALGKSKFTKLCRDYLSQTSLAFFNLAELSKNFPDYVRKRTKKSFGEVARFEWMENLCFLTEDPAPFQVTETIAATDPQKLCFVTNPSLFLFESDFKVLSKKLLEQRSRLILYREHGRVQIQALKDKEFLVLSKIQQGYSLEKLYHYCEKHTVGEKIFAKWISNWTSQKVISGISAK